MSSVYLFWILRAENYGPVLFYRRMYVHQAGLAQRRWSSKVLVFLDVPYKRVLVSRSGIAFCPSLVMSDARHSEWDETKLVYGWVGWSRKWTDQTLLRRTPDIAIYRECWGRKTRRSFSLGLPLASYYLTATTYNEQRTNCNETRAWLPFHREYNRRISFARPIFVLRVNLPQQVNCAFLDSASEKHE